MEKLIHHKFKNISVTRIHWLKHLHRFVERFYKHHVNINVRVKTIDYLKEVLDLNRSGYEEEILEKVIIVIFADIAQENEIKVRIAASALLLDICYHCDTKRSLELLDILEKVIL